MENISLPPIVPPARVASCSKLCPSSTSEYTHSREAKSDLRLEGIDQELFFGFSFFGLMRELVQVGIDYLKNVGLDGIFNVVCRFES